MTKKAVIVLIAIVVGVTLAAGLFVYDPAVREVKHFMSTTAEQGSSNDYAADIDRFLQYGKKHQLPAPSVDVKTASRPNPRTKEILATCTYIAYDSDHRVTGVETGILLFTVTRKGLTWAIQDIEIVQPMGQANLASDTP